MRAHIQRVSKASVAIDNTIIGKIDHGFVVLLGITHSDTESDIALLLEKIIHMRIFTDTNGKFNDSLLDVDGSLLVVSQFTLYADCRKGRRPSFSESAAPEIAKPLYEKFIEEGKKKGVNVQTGKFGGNMQVELINDGPVTILLDSKNT